MQTPNSYTVLISRIFTVLLLLIMGIWGWKQRGLLFSPGRLSAKTQPGITLQGFRSHAEFEKECERCHQSLQTQQAFLCTECHTNISEQIEAQDDVHGKLNNILECEKCHPDHRGKDFDPAQAALEFFDHNITSFRLLRHQINFDATPLACSRCHLSPEFDAKNQNCEDCHAAHQTDFMSQHLLDFGKGCLTCHDGVDSMARFDHTQTDFHLKGLHIDVQCSNCHIDGQFQDISMDCEQCHQEPKTHLGLFTETCITCHTEAGWSPALLDNELFEHATQTGFSLVLHTQDYEEQPLICTTCHQDDLETFSVQTCITCHKNYDGEFINQHNRVFGTDCLVCHDGFDRYSDFNHENLFPLVGQHITTSCEACHINRVFQGTSAACSSCHEEPLIHADWFGLQCQNCHTETAWSPAAMVRHNFPLEHGKADPTSCTTCHVDKYIKYTCYGCHDHEQNAIELTHIEAGVTAEELQDCVQCHSAGTVEEPTSGN